MSINEIIFDEPSDNVRGVVTAFVTLKNKEKRIAHATLFIDYEPKTYFEAVNSVSLDDFNRITDELKLFVKRVRELESNKISMTKEQK